MHRELGRAVRSWLVSCSGREKSHFVLGVTCNMDELVIGHDMIKTSPSGIQWGDGRETYAYSVQRTLCVRGSEQSSRHAG